MTLVDFTHFVAMLLVAMIVIRAVEIWGPSFISTPLGALFHA